MLTPTIAEKISRVHAVLQKLNLSYFLKGLGRHFDFSPRDYLDGACYFCKTKFEKKKGMRFLKHLLLFSNAIGWLHAATGQDFLLEKLSENINTSYDEISPILTRDGKTLYFTRVASPDFNKQLIVEGFDVASVSNNQFEIYLKNIYSTIAERTISQPAHSDFNQDVWVAECHNGLFDEVSHPGAPLNNALPNSICSLTPNPDEFIVINQFKKEGGMSEGFSLIQKENDGSWSFPKPLMIRNYYTESEGVNLTMSRDGEVLILSIDREDSFGANDLYAAFRVGNNEWSTPQNLGTAINSQFRETTPFLSADQNTLFFSSNRPGFGGSDIYFARRKDDTWTNWSTPRPMGYSINSASDESQPYFNEATGYLYFSSKRDGSSDIFRIKIKEPKRRKDISIKGRVINTKTGQPIDAQVLIGSSDLDFYRSVQFSIDGSFKLDILSGKDFKIKAQRAGFISHPLRLSYKRDLSNSRSIEIKLFIDPIENYAKIHLEPIYFVRSKPIILEKSFYALDQLVDILSENPNLFVLIEGHTDNRGKPSGLLELSEKRARAIKEYLRVKNIDAYRMTTKGFGANRPITDNSTEALRAENRRVEVRIITEPEG